MYDVLVRVCIIVLQGGEAASSALQNVGVCRGTQACRQQLLSLTAGVHLTPAQGTIIGDQEVLEGGRN